IFILTDLEGPAMIFGFDQTRLPEAAGNMAQSKRLLTLEVNACVDGILDADPQAEVVVWDGHGSGGIDYELFHERAQLVAGRGVRAPYRLDGTFDALFFVGQHAMAGTPDAPLAHTYSSRTIEYYQLNGVPIGEFGLRATMAGTLCAVPTAFLSGDDKAVAEAQALVPELVGVTTKIGLGREAAQSLAPARAWELIRAGATAACRLVQAGQIAPVRVPPPYRFEVRVLPGQEASLNGYLQRGANRLDERTVVLGTDDPRAVLR
ncbi:MAG: M55 family metallopeptidase, partial [Chloroflexota bacterium]